MPDSIQERLYGTLGVRGKDSVARMTWDGISYVVSVSNSNIYYVNVTLLFQFRFITQTVAFSDNSDTIHFV